jgi:hypothetical protein
VVQRLRIETILFTQDQIVTETRAYYFDISRVDGVPHAGVPLVEWTDPRSMFSALYQIGWLHFDRAVDNSRGNEVLDTTLFYSALGTKATIYVYDSVDRLPELPLAERRAKELRLACDEVRAIHPDVEPPSSVYLIEPFAFQHFLAGEDITIAGVAALRKNFLKLRLTSVDDRKMRNLMDETVRELARFVRMSERGTFISSHVRH